MAGQQPIEERSTSDVPGAFPETPAPIGGEEKKDGLAAAGVLGGIAAAGAAVLGTASFSKDDEGKSTSQDVEKPAPEDAPAVNQIKLDPTEPVPDATTGIKKDNDALHETSSSGAPVLPHPLSPQSEAEAGGAPIFGLGPQTTNMIPESSMPMGKDMPPPIDGKMDAGPFTSSVGPTSTTAQLAGQVPLEPRGIPQVVDDSQREAHAAPEASANRTAIEGKEEVENELKAKVPEEQAGSESKNTENKSGIAAAVTGGMAAVGAAAVAGAAAVREKTHETTGTDPVSVLPQSVQDSINNMNKSSGSTTAAATGGSILADHDGARDTATSVPPKVEASQKAAHFDPEAAANPEAVQEKNATENELLSKVPETEASGEPAPALGTATSSTAAAVPHAVETSQKAAHADPEAAANPEAVQEKNATENELLSKVRETQASGEPAPTLAAATSATAPTPQTTSSGAPQLADPVGSGFAPIKMDEKPVGDSKDLNAPATAMAAPPIVPAAAVVPLPAATAAPPAASTIEDPSRRDMSRDYSPMSKPDTTTQTKPSVTTGVDSSKAPVESKPETPKTHQKRNSIFGKSKGTPDSPSTTTGTEGKKNKKSLFKRIKDSFKA